MVDRPLPVLFREDYPAFRQIMPNLPDSFDAWHSGHIEELRAAYGAGETPIDVIVYPDAYVQFLRRHGSMGSMGTLKAFAIERAVGH